MRKNSFAYVLAVPLAALAAVTASVAWAHHSFAAYDMSKAVTVLGTIKEFRWGAPHSSMVLAYIDKNGKGTDITVLSGSPTAFVRQGFNPRDFRRGDKVELTYHPNSDGALGGALASLKLANGRTYTDSEIAAAAPKPQISK